MRIKRIEILGFKSFNDKTVLNIEEPVTAVVGPNGCGKSNIIDAIRWCMGEQSAKHLRGKAMEDVIFGGSETRSPAGMAEVSLTFENVGLSVSARPQQPDILDAALDPGGDSDDEEEPDPTPAIDYSQYGEVTVTRRLFRDGTSEYYLNKTACRLRDITDFFLGTGVGTKAYSIIEQGRVGLIVSAKPEDRRLIIEEAAGITKFKKKKQAAERKMADTRANLLRVSDIVSEIDKQLATLRRQAQKAERYKKYRSEVRDIELWSASHRYLGLRAERDLLAGHLAEARAAREEAETAHLLVDAAVVAERAAAAVEERQLSDLQGRVFELENRVKLGESQVEFQQREAADLEARAAAAAMEIAGLERQVEEGRLEASQMAANLARLEGEAGARVAEQQALERDLGLAREDMTAATAELEEARAEIGRAQTEIARHENGVRSLDRRRGDLEVRAGRMAEEEARAAARADELNAEVAAQEARLEGLRLAKAELGERRGALEGRKSELEAELKILAPRVETLRGELNRRRSRQKALREIHDRYEGFARGTRAVMKHRPGERDGRKIRGLVADALQAPPDLETAVESLLGERLGAVLVDETAVALDALSFLRQRGEGRSTFIPVAAFGGAAPVSETAPALDGVRGRVADLLRCADDLRPVVQHLVDGTLVVENLGRALELQAGGLARPMVTLDGDVLDGGGILSGGSREAGGAGVLGQAREIRELEEACVELDRELEAATARLAAVKEELGQTSGILEALRKEGHQSELAIVTTEKDVVRWRSEADRLNERRAQVGRERAEVDAQLAETIREAEETQLALTRARGRAGDAEHKQLGLIEGVTLSRRSVDDAQTRVTEAKVRAAQIGAERTAVRAHGQRLEEARRELERRVEKLHRAISDGGERSRALREEAAFTAEELVGLRADRRAGAEALADGRTAHETRLVALQEQELKARALRQRLDKLHTEVSRLEMRLGTLDADHKHLEESVSERHRVELRRELFDHHLRPPVGEVEEARLRELKELIERMGEINLTAIEEFEEQAKRHEYLVGQKADLVAALDQLEKAIAKINKTSRRRFRETFDAVNAKFKEIFPRLFRGGRAELRLVGGESDDEILDAGIEILAQPPGKKNVTVELMSGGEKALTAVALIFAIFLIKPSPFCILDEVDAPLDEANVGRYNDMVREMTDRSQFIVITHNKRTMEIADTLFGITMEEPGCSKLVNVNLRAFDGGQQRAA